jgi:protocatechuate 3,4-dioxygenase beta subunit
MQKHDDIGCIFRRHAQHAGTVRAIPFAALTTLIATTGCLDNASHVAAAPTAPAPARNQSAREETEWGGAADAPAHLSWQTVIAPKDEPGERLVISGTVFAEDGVTPAKNVLLYVYHTNAKGVYPKRTADNGPPQLASRVSARLDATGATASIRFHTIRPASYPGRTAPAAHIHATVSAPGLPGILDRGLPVRGRPAAFPQRSAGKRAQRLSRMSSR